MNTWRVTWSGRMGPGGKAGHAYVACQERAEAKIYAGTILGARGAINAYQCSPGGLPESAVVFQTSRLTARPRMEGVA